MNSAAKPEGGYLTPVACKPQSVHMFSMYLYIEGEPAHREPDSKAFSKSMFLHDRLTRLKIMEMNAIITSKIIKLGGIRRLRVVTLDEGGTR